MADLVAEPLDEWTTRNPLPQGNYLAACAYGNGRWVALGAPGALVTSTDGQNWITSAEPPASGIEAMAYGNGLFVAVGRAGWIWTSQDGLRWTPRRTGDWTFNLTSIAYGNGVFVASGHANTAWGTYPLLCSADGIHWEDHSPASNFYKSVAFGNGAFIVTDSLGDGVWRSTNGKNWTRVSAAGYRSGKVAFGSGKFIIFQPTRRNGHETFSSTDGLSWTRSGNTGADVDYDSHFMLVGTDGGFALSGMRDPDTLSMAAYTSDDGISWNGSLLPKSSGKIVVTHAGGLYVVVGSGGQLHTSKDCKVWTTHVSEFYHLRDVTYANGLFVSVGESSYLGEITAGFGGYFYLPKSTIGPERSILTSPDGITWTPRGVKSASHLSVAYGNGRFVTTGLATSEDGLTWTDFKSFGPYRFDEVRFLNGMFVMVGDAVFTSSTGLDWELRHSIGDPDYNNIESVAYGAGKFVAVGYNTSSQKALVYTSLDGISWVGVSTHLPPLIKVRFGNGKFLAVSSMEGSVYSSIDGVTWTDSQFSTGGGASRCGFDFGNGEFVLAFGGGIWTSNTGETWTLRKSPNSNALAGVTFANSTFVAVGDQGTIIQSALFREPRPVIRSAATAAATVGQPFSYQITASNNPTSYAERGLPSGLSLNRGTGLISGTPATAGTSTVTLSATNVGGTGNKTLTLTVNPPAPVISSAETATATVGQPFFYQITASNNPTSYAERGLPSGLSLYQSTGVIWGTPTTAGTSTVTLSATNGGGTGNKTLTLTVYPAPSLDNLVVSSGRLAPAFDPLVTSYTVVVGSAVSSITITPIAADPAASIKVNGVQQASGVPSRSIALRTASTLVEVQITAGNGVAVTSYWLSIDRGGPRQATLSALWTSAGRLTPKFSRFVRSYRMSVPNRVSSLKLRPTASQARSIIRINGDIVRSRSRSAGIPLRVGENIVRIRVSAKNHAPRTYTIVVTRGRSSSTRSVFAAVSDHLSDASASLSLRPEISKILVDGKLFQQATVVHPIGSPIPRVEVSGDLIQWFSGPRHTTMVSKAPGRVTVRDNTPVSTGTKRYIRVDFTKPADQRKQ